MRPLVYQYAVVAGVWWCLLVDAIGNWAGQDHYAAWLPIIYGVAILLVVVHLSAAHRLLLARQATKTVLDTGWNVLASGGGGGVAAQAGAQFTEHAGVSVGVGGGNTNQDQNGGGSSGELPRSHPTRVNA